jgi:hypothetical protein
VKEQRVNFTYRIGEMLPNRPRNYAEFADFLLGKSNSDTRTAVLLDREEDPGLAA